MSKSRPKRSVASEFAAYFQSAEFLALAPSTQAEYGRVGAHLVAEIGAGLLSNCDRAWLRRLRNEWAQGGHRYASMRLQLLKNALKPACEDELISAHLFNNLGKVTPKGRRIEARLAWADEEVEAAISYAIERNQEGLARAIGLGRWAGFRRGTICEITLEARIITDNEHGPERRLRWATSKTGVLADKPEDPRLTELLDERTVACAPYIAYNIYGFGWTPRQLSQALDRIVARLSAERLVRRDLSWHGLRHARGVELAEANAADAVIMAQLEHKTTHSAQVYRRQAGRGRLADVGQRLVNQARSTRRSIDATQRTISTAE